MEPFPQNLVVKTDRRFLNRPSATPQLLQVIGVDSKWTDYIRILDSCGNLVLLHYLTTFIPGSTDINTEPLSEIGHVRGIIIDRSDNSIVCRSFPYTPEVTSNDPELEKLLPNNLHDTCIFQACEGTILRLFWWKGDGEHDANWYLSTHRKISAYNSYWGGPTFGNMFQEVQKFEYDTLNKNYSYIFLMSHPANRLIYKVEHPQLLHLSTYDRQNKKFLPVQHLIPNVPLPRQLHDIENVTQLADTVEQLATSNRFDLAGIIVIPDQTNPQPVKIISPTYHDLRRIRGNDPSLRSRYLHLRNTPDRQKLVDWYSDELYQEKFTAAEQEFNSLAGKLHQWYINRFVHKNIEQLPKEEFVTLQRCHSWHVENRSSNIVTLEKVKEILGTTPGHYLVIMINRHRTSAAQTVKEVEYPED